LRGRLLNSNLTYHYRNVLKGKKLLVIGDSWCGSWNGTENLTPWATRLATMTGAICENHAFPGSGFVATGNLNKNYATAISELDGDFDAIIVQGGINDIVANPTAETIKTAVANFATNCRTKFPNRDIYFIPTTQCVPLNITQIQVIFNIMLEARKHYLITCKETASISISSPNYAGDLTHLSDAGYDELARCVAQFLSEGTSKVTKETIHYPNSPAYMFYNMTPPAGITWTGMYIRVEGDIVNFYGTANFANDTTGDFVKIMDGLPPAIAPYTASNYAFDTFPAGSDPAFAYRVAFMVGQEMFVQTMWTNMKNHTLFVIASYTTNENTELFTTT